MGCGLAAPEQKCEIARIVRVAAKPEARHDLSCAALAHTEELLDRQAVEVRGCHGTQGAEDFVKSMKPGWLGGHGGSSYSTIR